MRQRSLCIFIIVPLTGAPAAAQTVANWLNPVSGDWTDPTMWSSNPFYPNNGNPGGSTYHARLAAGGAPYTVQLADTITLDALTLLSPDATVVAASGELTVGSLSQSAGRLRLAGANVAIPRFGPVTGGEIHLSGGTLTAGSPGFETDLIGPTVLFEHTGGVHQHSGEHFFVGGGARYQLSGGTASFARPNDWGLLVGSSGSGAFHQTAGTCRIEAQTYVAIGIADLSQPTVAHAGTLVIDGPQSQFLAERQLGDSGDVYVGYSGDDTSGMVTVSNGASAHFGIIGVGVSTATGTVHVQSGGHAQFSMLGIGNLRGSTFTSGNGVVTVTGAGSRLTVGSLGVYVGLDHGGGSGRLKLDDGTLTVNAAIISSVGLHVQRSGRFEMNGGYLDCRRRMIVSGTFEMNGGAGTLLGLSVISGGVVRVADGELSVGTVLMNAFGNAQTSLNLDGGRFAASLLSVNTGRVSVGLGSGVVPRVNAVAMTTGRVDLADSGMVIDHGGASPLLQVRALILSGRNGGTWDGDGIISSVAPAQPGYALGYAESTAMFSTFPVTFGGWDIDDTAVIVRYTRLGDANLDGAVNLADFNRLASSFGIGPDALWQEGDFNYDGAVSLADFNLLAANFGLSAAGRGVTPQDWAALARAVPEPGALAAFGVAASVAACGRRRRGGRDARGASTAAE